MISEYNEIAPFAGEEDGVVDGEEKPEGEEEEIE